MESFFERNTSRVRSTVAFQFVHITHIRHNRSQGFLGPSYNTWSPSIKTKALVVLQSVYVYVSSLQEIYEKEIGFENLREHLRMNT